MGLSGPEHQTQCLTRGRVKAEGRTKDEAVTDEPRPRRFLAIEQAAEELNVNPNQSRALLRSGELRGIQVDGRGVWRIGANDVEDSIAEAYRRTAERIAAGEVADDVEPGSE